ncbi:MAG: hypothetical protein AAFZ06_08320 [Pseudomonadota bacterium]
MSKFIHTLAAAALVAGAVSATPALADRNVTITGKNGGQATRHINRSYDPHSNTYSRSREVTGPYRGSRTREGTYDPETNTYNGSRTVTDPYGGSRTRWIEVTPVD